MKNLVLAGGVALNCVGNGRILREGPFENIWIQPAAGDAGGALGAALFVWHQLLDTNRKVGPRDDAARLAPRAGVPTTRSSRRFSTSGGGPYHCFERRSELCDACRDSDRHGEGRRLVPGADGVRPARAGQPQHPRRRPQRARCSR